MDAVEGLALELLLAHATGDREQLAVSASATMRAAGPRLHSARAGIEAAASAAHGGNWLAVERVQ